MDYPLSSERVSGVYGLFCTDSGKVYVGQSVHMYHRFTDHIKKLRRGTHTSRHLQSAFSKYGEAAFEFRVLEEVPEDMLGAREKSWIRYFCATDRRFGYNTTEGGDAPRHSPEALKIMSEKSKARGGPPRKAVEMAAELHRGKPLSEEHRTKISLSLRGKKKPSEHVQKVTAALNTEAVRNKMRAAHARRKQAKKEAESGENV